MELPDIKEKFVQIMHSQPNHLNEFNKYYLAVKEFEETLGLKPPYSNYESFKSARSRKHNKK